MKTRTPEAAVLIAMMLASACLTAGSCASNPQPSSASPHEQAPAAGLLSGRGEGPEVLDLTQAGVGAPHVGPLPTTDFGPEHERTMTIVPWDSAAILEVRPAGDPLAGALVVRYGKYDQVFAGGAGTMFTLEAPGHEIEPISLQWQATDGADLRAIARVDGELRRYDFDREGAPDRTP